MKNAKQLFYLFGLMHLFYSSGLLAQEKKIWFRKDSVFVYTYATLAITDYPVKNRSWDFPDSLANGTWVVLYQADSSKAREIGNYKDGKKNGKFYSLDFEQDTNRVNIYKKGEHIRSILLKDGTPTLTNNILENKLISWYSDGTRESQTTPRLIEGWYPNGNKKYYKERKNGKLDGKVLYWYPEGRIMYQGSWKKGLEQEAYYSRKPGKPLKNIKLKNLPKKLQLVISKDW